MKQWPCKEKLRKAQLESYKIWRTQNNWRENYNSERNNWQGFIDEWLVLVWLNILLSFSCEILICKVQKEVWIWGVVWSLVLVLVRTRTSRWTALSRRFGEPDRLNGGINNYCILLDVWIKNYYLTLWR